MANEIVENALLVINQRGLASECSIGELQLDFEKFQQILIKWQRVQNLVSRETLDQYWQRHVADSLQLLSNIKQSDKLIVDFGSGGGFPAIPLAIVLKNSEVEFILVESNSRKVAFLRALKRELGLNIVVKDMRIDDFKLPEKLKPDLITARALAGLDDLLAFSQPHWGEKTRALFLKGKEYAEEVEKARIRWGFNVLIVDNVIDDSGVLLEISNLHTNL